MNLASHELEFDPQGSFWVWAQPMKDVTMLRCFLLVKPIHRMIPDPECERLENLDDLVQDCSISPSLKY